MKHLSSFLRLSVVAGLVFVSTACNNVDEVEPTNKGESAFTRLLITDAESGEITLVNPSKQSSERFTARFGGSNVYPTASGRYAVLVNYANDFVQFFDSGIVDHGDHADVKGTPKWAAATSSALKPTHVYAMGDNIAIFNDGEGSMTLFRETDLHATAVQPKTVKVDIPHHGALVAFSNGTYAVTKKNPAITGSLPQGVRIVDGNGTVVHEATQAVTGIHGDAGNGETALFGTTDGVLVVQSNGSQRLIPYPSEFEKNWFGTIVHDAVADAFYGYTAKLGVYRIDVSGNRLTPVVVTDQLHTFKVDKEGREVFALLNDGTLKVHDGRTGVARREAKIIGAIDPAAKVKPDMTITKKFVYLTDPQNSNLLILKRSDLSRQPAIAVPGKPAKLAVIGAQQNVSGDD